MSVDPPGPFSSVATVLRTSPVKFTGALGRLFELAEVCSLTSYTGYGEILVVAYHNTVCQHALLEHLRCIHSEDVTLIVEGKLGESLPAQVDERTRCIILLDVPLSRPLLARLSTLSRPAQRVDTGVPRRRGIICLCEAHAITPGRDTQNVLLAAEPQGQTVTRALLEHTESQFTRADAELREPARRFHRDMQTALEHCRPIRVILPPIRPHFGPELTPQSPVRARQILEIAGALTVVRSIHESTSSALSGAPDCLDDAVRLYNDCAISDDWPTIPEHLIRLGEIFAQLPWNSQGMTYAMLQAELNREHPGAAMDPGFWPPTAVPSDHWSYETIRRRTLKFERLGWLTRKLVDGELRWFPTPDLSGVLGSRSRFIRPLPKTMESNVDAANGSGFSSSPANVQASSGPAVMRDPPDGFQVSQRAVDPDQTIVPEGMNDEQQL